MPFRIILHDITTMETDAIVNAANSGLREGGGVCGAIFRRAGSRELQNACDQIGRCPTGSAVITPGYHLHAKYVIHAVGPIYRDGRHQEKEQLRSCYESSLELAAAHQLSSIAFPLISAGIYGYPKDQALAIATEAIRSFLDTHEMEVYLCLFRKEDLQLDSALQASLQNCLSAPDRTEERSRIKSSASQFSENISCSIQCLTDADLINSPRDLSELLRYRNETFTEMLLRLIDEKGLEDVTVYKRANLDRKLFSKIRSARDGYQPSKATVLALAIGMSLSLEETEDLLAVAGYALSPAYPRDVIVRYFLQSGHPDIMTVNQALFAFGEETL